MENNRRPSQAAMVLDYLQTHVGITDNEARDLFGINRLSGRIFELRQDGHAISTVTHHCTNRYGKKVKYGEYRLQK